MRNMSPIRIEFAAYFMGVIMLGLFYPQLKTALSGPVFFVAVICYLVAVRGVGYLVNRHVSKASSLAGGGDD